MSVLTITSDNFESEVLSSSRPVLIDFWATWCGPCRMQSPIVDALSDEYDDITVGKINVDEEEELAVRYGIQSIPTLMVFIEGDVTATAVGLQSKKNILKMLGKA